MHSVNADSRYPAADMPRMPPPKVVRGNKPQSRGEPPDPSLISKFQKPEAAKLKFNESEIGPNRTDLETIACQNALPQLVQVTEDFAVDGNVFRLNAGDIIMIHMIVEREVVHAVDDQGLDIYLPIQAEQVYERLTVDDRVDDRLYIGVESLLKADILPPMVRVIENYYSADPSECVDDEDVLELYRVDVAPEEIQHRGRMCVYGKNQQGYQLHLHRGMTTAHFTTKLSALFHPMTELIEHSFPQRVRIPSIDPNRPNIKAEKILRLLGVENEFHVIATQPGRRDIQVLAIPSKVPIRMTLATGNFRHVAKSLPSVYTLVNPTWHVDQVGRATLSPSFQQLPQPTHGVLKPWLNTFEGKVCVKEATKVNDIEIKRQITELKNEVDMWKNLYDTIKLSQPERPIRTDVPPPVRPPKPGRKPTKPTTPDKPPTSPKPSKKNYVKGLFRHSSKYEKGKEVPPSPTSSTPAQTPTDTSYEEPTCNIRKQKVSGHSDDDEDEACYEVIPEEIVKSNLREQLERKIKSQEQMIEGLRKQEATLKKELREAKSKNDDHVHKIYTLQQEIESLLNKDDIYDTISEDVRPQRPPPNANIYNTPSTGATPGMKVSVEQLQTYTVAGVETFLKEIKLEKHSTNFRIEGIDGPLLLALDESMLKELGMSAVDARRLYVRIGKTSGQ